MAGQLTGALAEFAATFPGAAIPPTARVAAARCLLDTLACALGGLAERSRQILLEFLDAEAADGPCSAIGLDRTLAAREAALVNGSLAHALDFDDTHDLDADGMAQAFGLALPQASGTLQSEHDGTWAKRLQAGLAAAGGTLAAQLAARGFQGVHEPLEGRFGFYRVYLREFDPGPVLEALGHRFEIERTSLKPFPTCRFTHAPAAALQGLMRGHRLLHEDLETIEARLTSAAFAEVCEPVRDKVRPTTRVHAQLSLPYALACVAHHGAVTLADLTEEGIRREAVLALAERVECVKDADLEARWGEKIGEAECGSARAPERSSRHARFLPGAPITRCRIRSAWPRPETALPGALRI